MNNAVNINILSIVIIICICISLPLFYIQQTITFIVFCDVGQGDGIYIRIHNTYDILIDAGPDNKILSCLGKHMPFYDRTIELAIATHPQKDHIGGFEYILQRYHVSFFMMSRLTNTSKLYKRISQLLSLKNVSVVYTQQGDTIHLGHDTLSILWPSREFQDSNIVSAGSGMNLSSKDDNEFSIIALLNEGPHSILFTGDASAETLGRFTKSDVSDVSILKIPHHGSINGLSHYFLQLANPTLSVISVGFHNKFNHPSPELISLLDAEHKRYLRTDKEGNIKLLLYNTFFMTTSEH